MAFLLTTAGNQVYQHLSASPLFLPLLIILILLSPAFIRRLLTAGHGGKHSPPGPWRLPVIGNLHQLVSILPHRRLRQLALKYGPDVMHLQLGELSHIVVSSASAARQADIVVYAGNDLAFTAYTERYKQLRKICVVELLGANRVRGFRSIREEEVGKLVTAFSRKAEEAAEVNISEEVFWLSTRLTSRTALGKARERDDGFLNMVGELSDVLGGFKGYKAKLVRMHKKLDLILDDIINEHKVKRSDHERQGDDVDEDLVDVLLNRQKNGTEQFSLTTENIKAVIVETFLAGVETSATAIDWTMAEMMRENRVLQKAQKEVRQVYAGKATVDEASIHELTYLDLVIKESLRLRPPLPLLLPRECREKIEINGYEIPANTKVIINGWAIGRDGRYWDQPDKFYPERFLDRDDDKEGMDFEFIPFGSGRRMCPGMLYASAVVKLVLANLLFHFDWKLPSGMKSEDLDMTEAFGVSVRRKCGLCLIPVKPMS
ncbi:Premnaspirodiene oxygenase [Linum grandiflorum]